MYSSLYFRFLVTLVAIANLGKIKKAGHPKKHRACQYEDNNEGQNTRTSDKMTNTQISAHIADPWTHILCTNTVIHKHIHRESKDDKVLFIHTQDSKQEHASFDKHCLN